MPTSMVLLLAIVTLLNSIALIALARQVGILHLRSRPVAGLDLEEGPQPGDHLAIARESASESQGPSMHRILNLFFSPGCRLCGPVLSALKSLAGDLRPEESVIVITDASEGRAREYLTRRHVNFPLVARPNVMTENQIPGTPFLAITDNTGKVIVAAGVNSLEQIEIELERARVNGNGSKGSVGGEVAHGVR